MNTFFRSFFSISALLCVCCLPGLPRAMPYADYVRLLHASPDYQAADSELNAVWAKARKSLARGAFLSLRQEQRLWLKERDSLAAALIAQKLPVDQAYARVTRDRIAVISALLESAKKAKSDRVQSFFTPSSKALLHKTLAWQRGEKVSEAPKAQRLGTLEQSNQSAAKPSVDICDAFRVSTRLYYGHYVPRPFVTFNLNVKKGRRVNSLMVNNYEIRRINRFSKVMPQWKRRSDRILELNLFSDTILNDIAIVYNDGTMCRIDNINIEKDMTNPYN